jgi:hypothetical protein
MITTSTVLGSMPAAVMFAANCPTGEFACCCGPLPVSITTSFEPVFTTIGVNGMVIVSLGMNTDSRPALTSALGLFRTKVSGSGNVRAPSVMAVTSKVPTLWR